MDLNIRDIEKMPMQEKSANIGLLEVCIFIDRKTQTEVQCQILKELIIDDVLAFAVQIPRILAYLTIQQLKAKSIAYLNAKIAYFQASREAKLITEIEAKKAELVVMESELSTIQNP